MIAAFRSWSMPPSEARWAMSSRSVSGGSRYSRGSRRAGPSAASVTPPGWRNSCGSRAPSAGPEGGSGRVASGDNAMGAPAPKTEETTAGDGRGAGIAGRPTSRGPRPERIEPSEPSAKRPFDSPGRARRPFAADPASAGGAVIAAPTLRAARPTGRTRSRTPVFRARTSPAMATPRRTTNAPGRLTRPARRSPSEVPIRPPLRPPSAPAFSSRAMMPRAATYAIVAPRRVRRQPDPHPLRPLDVEAEAQEQERKCPAPRPEPRGDDLEDPVRQGTLAGQEEADEDDRPEDHENDGHQRAGDVG